MLGHPCVAFAAAACVLLLISPAAAAVANPAAPHLSLSINRVENAAAIADKMDGQIDSGESAGKQWNAPNDGRRAASGDAEAQPVGAKDVENPFDVNKVSESVGASGQGGSQGNVRANSAVGAHRVPVAATDLPPLGSKPLPPHEMIARYRQVAQESIGYDGSNAKLVESSLRRQITMLEQLVLKGAMPTAQDFGSEAEFQSALSACEQTKLDLREAADAAVKLTNENRDYKTMLKEEHATLVALEARVDHPELTSWIVNRAGRLSSIFNTDETDAAAGYAKRLIGPEVSFAKSKLSDLEDRVERSVDTVVPSQFGHVVALAIAGITIGFPTLVTLAAMASIHKAISVRQHVLLCNVFATALVAAVGFCGIILREDPLEALHVSSDSGFFAVHFILVGFCAGLMAMLVRALYQNYRNERDMIVFGSQILFFLVICYNYNSRVLKPALLGYTIDANPLMYIVYLLDFSAMTLLTMSTGMAVEDTTRILPDYADTATRKRNMKVEGRSSAFSALASGLSGAAVDVKDA